MSEKDLSLKVVVDEHYIHAILLAKVITRLLRRQGNIKLSDKPIVQEKKITEFMDRLRVSTIEKFNTTTYIGVVNFYQNSKEMKVGNSLGVIILYVEEEYLAHLSKRLGYPLEDDDDDPEYLAIACGTICNLIAGNFKSGMCQLGYQDMEMSHFSSFRNSVFGGVPYPLSETRKHEVSFYIDGVIRVYADVMMGDALQKRA